MIPHDKRPLALIILDGWGFSSNTSGNAIAQAHTPYYDEICRQYPNTTLAAAGARVGLPAGAVGNAEVGHLNIGAGRVVQTDIARISDAIRSGTFSENETLRAAFGKARSRSAAVHFVGLLSDGGVHSSQDCLFALLRMAKKEGLSDVFIHGFLDGRDVQPRTADIYVEALEIKMADIGIGRIATLCGRFFAMDGNHNWERTARAYTMLVHSEGERASDPRTTIRNSFLRGISDEFIAPIVLEREPGVPVARVKDGDLVVFFNHRPDTMRQLVRSLAVSGGDSIMMAGRPNIDVVCLTEYDHSFGLPVAFERSAEANVLAQVFADHGRRGLRVTETGRVPHINYFLNGGSDLDLGNEDLQVLDSGSSASHETHPEMSSFKIADSVIRGLRENSGRFFVVNIPGAGIIAESGNLEKTIEAVQFVDTCLGGIVEKIREANGIAVITSSHGNCEEIHDGRSPEPNSYSTANDVPFHIVDDAAYTKALREGGALEDVAPTILGILGIEKPAEMTGSDLRIAK